MATIVPLLDGAPQQPDALEPKSFKYAAFISYSHEDRRIGAAIQSKLEKYVLPRASQILGPDAARHPFARVFRDEDELVPDESLPKRIREALETLSSSSQCAAQRQRRTTGSRRNSWSSSPFGARSRSSPSSLTANPTPVGQRKRPHARPCRDPYGLPSSMTPSPRCPATNHCGWIGAETCRTTG
jgi:hypothetical protein